MKTSYSSYCNKGLAKGCKYCVKGEKLVLFISGICNINCYYCSLSKKRKNKDVIYANETICKKPKDAIKEAIESSATSAGITGGDPFLFVDRVILYAKALKKHFGANFHIHIYLPTRFITKEKLKKFSKIIDEVRFHPEFLIKELSNEEKDKELEKIKLACLFWDKKNIGIELPAIPEKKTEILDFIIKASRFIGFANLNELEISDTNFNCMTNSYDFNNTGYVIKGSRESALCILKKLKEKNINIKIHFCTADLKNHHQFKNRLKKHLILPYGFKTKDGTVKYLAIYSKDNSELKKITKEIKKETFFIDKKKSRIILSEPSAKRLLKIHKIELVEEFPTSDMIEVEREIIS